MVLYLYMCVHIFYTCGTKAICIFLYMDSKLSGIYVYSYLVAVLVWYFECCIILDISDYIA